MGWKSELAVLLPLVAEVAGVVPVFSMGGGPLVGAPVLTDSDNEGAVSVFKPNCFANCSETVLCLFCSSFSVPFAIT